MARAGLLLAEGVAAAGWPALTAALWPEAPLQPSCLLASFTGEAVLLGRFGVMEISPAPGAVFRRATGGPALRASAGCLGIALPV